jgi:hypothetical protein
MAQEDTDTQEAPLQPDLQPDAENDSPSGVLGADAERDTRGRFQKGNRAAVVTGGRSTAFWAAQEAHRRAIVAEVLRDHGQAGEPSYALRASADGLAQSTILRDSAFERLLEMGGPLTENDRHRSAFPVWQACSASVERHARLLGLERKVKDVAKMSIHEWLATQGPERG